MATMTIERRPFVHWGASVTGAFFAVAIATVLGLFGAAFGRAGATVLSGVWQILTPLVAVCAGAVIAVSLSERRGAYLNGLMVWALGVAYAGALFAASAPGARVAGERMVVGSGTTLALAGLATILGLVGSLIGSAIGSSLEGRIARRAEEMAATEERGYHPTFTAEPTSPPPSEVRPTERPELRH